MVDKISKAISKFPDKDYDKIRDIFQDIDNRELSGYDIKKIKGQRKIYRIRMGSIRIIFEDLGDRNKIIGLERRSDNTYKNKN